MAGTVHLKRNTGASINTQLIENVENVGVADPYVILTFTDGSTVLERNDKIEGIQFTPYPTDSEGTNGESGDNSGD